MLWVILLGSFMNLKLKLGDFTKDKFWSANSALCNIHLLRKLQASLVGEKCVPLQTRKLVTKLGACH